MNNPKDIIPLGDVVEKIVGGGTPSRKIEEYYEGDIPWVTVKDLTHHKLSDSQEHITEDAITNSSANLITKGNVIVSTRMGLGKAFINLVDVAINQDLKALFPKLDKVTPEYLLYSYLGMANKIEKMGTGTTVKGIRLEQLRALPIYLPSIFEQEKITEILISVDDAIEKTKAIIEKSEKVNRGLMQQLFTKGIGHSEFKKTDIGDIPKVWEVVRLEEIAQVERGRFSHRPRNDPKFYGGTIPFVQTGDITKAKGYLKSHSQTLNRLGLTVSKIFPKGTIMITIAANIGETAIASYDVCFPDSVVGIIANKEIDNNFLEFYLRTQRNYLNSIATESAQRNINLQTLKPLLVPLPKKEEMEKISKILLTFDDKLSNERSKLAKLNILRKDLMKNLLSGRMRVKVDSEEVITS
ncbi:restriction endonuclease subunit S [Neobacillus sp. 19]|uniref:restriction endonuclease subunit S n=1 Tax=Neobacillus sp. 19 TaxID=3394458 RepID=UPI003BF6C288